MKQYKEKCPMIVLGGEAGCFLGEYLAGGIIVALGLDSDDIPVGDFAGTGMHGGEMWIRSDKMPEDLPQQVVAEKADKKELEKIMPLISQFSEYFGVSVENITNNAFYKLTPNAKNPYRQLYTQN